MKHLLVSYHTCPMEEPGTGLAGGMNVFLRGLLPGLAARGISTDVITRGKAGAAEVVHPFHGVRILHFPCGWREPPSRESAYRSLPVFVRNAAGVLASLGEAYDAVSAHYWMSGVAAREIVGAIRRRGAILPETDRLALMYHTLEARKPGPADEAGRGLSRIRTIEEERLSREAGRVVFLSRHDFERTRKILPAVTGKSSIVPPGVDGAFGTPPQGNEARRKAGVPADAFLFLLAARADPGKNVEAAVEAFRVLRAEEGGRPRLLIAGQDLPPGMLPEGVSCTGPVPHGEMPALFAAADAVLCPSGYESFGLVPLEAMAAGRPVAAPLGGYWGDRFVSEGGGIAYAPGSATGLIEAMRALCRDAAKRKRLGKEGKLIAAEFTWEKCTESWARILSRCAMRGNPR